MRFVSVRDLRGKSAEVWRRLSQDKDLVVTSNGRPLALLSLVSEATLEESLTALRQARAVAAVAALQRDSAERGLDKLGPAEVDAVIVSVRKKRRK